MEAQNTIQAQLLAVLQDLPMTRQAEVLDFALFLRDRELAEVWDAIPDDVAAVLQAEFAAEDLEMAEAGMGDSLARLAEEDRT